MSKVCRMYNICNKICSLKESKKCTVHELIDALEQKEFNQTLEIEGAKSLWEKSQIKLKKINDAVALYYSTVDEESKKCFDTIFEILGDEKC